MEGRRKASSLEEGLKNTEIKRETDIRNSLGPQESSERGRSSSERSRSSGRSSGMSSFERDSDAYGRETPGRSEDRE